MNEHRGKRGFIVSDTLIPWILVVLVIVVGFIVYGILSGKLQAIFEVLKNARRNG